MIDLPEVDSYPGPIAVDRDDTVWFALTQGHGVRQTIDQGPVLADTEGQLGWRTRDGALHHLRLSRSAESIRRLAADPSGGVWFTAFPHDAFGHADPHGALVDYTLPNPACLCATPFPEASPGATAGYAMAIQPGPIGTVWLVVQPGCQILHLDVATASVLHRFAGNGDPASYFAECQSAAAAPGGAVACRRGTGSGWRSPRARSRYIPSEPAHPAGDNRHRTHSRW